MNVKQIVAILLLIAGALSLTYGGFSYTEKTHEADVGPLHLAVDQERHISVPSWAGTIMLIVGAVLLIPMKKN